MTREVGHFEALTRELSTRAARATLGQLGLRNDPLREHLRSVFERPAGTPGSFLAEPVFEGIFPWESAEVTMAELAGQLLHPSLVAAMDQPAPALEEQRFPADRRPYLHQLNAWRVLASDPPRSAVVTSGTGSGKTECFLVPILDSLAREHERNGSALVGTRALFLYPLNALINSQRDRLRAWTRAFESDIRFCLYNGETPETVPAREQVQLPQETLSRRLLRESPPPILVTNATMLEYMLVRAQDAPIIHSSRGRLRWIVLDEAHTYVGSQAAELALLIRRVMLAFRVQPRDVRFVATSATMSTDDEDRTRAELKAFVADIAGIAPEQVAVVDGKRIVPPIASDWAAQRLGLPAPDECDALAPEARFERLATTPALRDLRETMARTPLRTSAIRERLGLNGGSLRNTLRLLDHGTQARTEDGAFLPLRGHLFHRTLRGLWACSNGACPGRRGTHLDAADWPFGALFLERREQCEHCHSPVFDVTVCNGCGVPFLACQEGIDEAHGRHLAARSFDSDYDEFEDELEVLDADLEGGDAEPVRGVGLHRLLAAPGGEALLTRIDAATGTLDPEDAGLDVGLIVAEPDGSLRCPSCSAREHIPGNVFRPVRLGAPFYLSVAIPAVLAQTPPIERDGASHPYDGRRLITFSDSRQGTARFAVKAQLDAERSYVRSTLYHQLAAVRPEPSSGLREEEQAQLAELNKIPNPAPAIRRLIEKLEAVAEEGDSAERLGRLSWNEAAHALQNSEPVRRWLGDQWNELALGAVPANQAARFCLYRELFRRPRRMNSLETLGLGALVYPAVERLQPERRPTEWRSRSLPLDTWKAFLTLALDFYVRAYSAVDIPGEYIRWLGIPVRPVFLIGPDADPPGPRQVRWPLLRGGAARNRLVRLLSAYLALDPDDPEHAARINAVLRAA